MNLPKTRKEWLETFRKAETGDISGSDLSEAGILAPKDRPIEAQSRNALAALAYIHGGLWRSLLGERKGHSFIRIDGAHQQDFDHGSVVANPGINNNVRVDFDKLMRRERDGLIATHFVVTSPGGDIYIDASIP